MSLIATRDGVTSIRLHRLNLSNKIFLVLGERLLFYLQYTIYHRNEEDLNVQLNRHGKDRVRIDFTRHSLHNYICFIMRLYCVYNL